MNIKLRQATIIDSSKIYELCTELKDQNARMNFAKIYSEQQIIDWIHDNDMYIHLALLDDEVIGMLTAKRGEGNKNHSVYLSAAVGKEHRGHGIVGALCAAQEKVLQHAEIKIMRTKIYSWNTPSIKAIKKAGFTQSGMSYMHEYDEERDEYIDDLIFYKTI